MNVSQVVRYIAQEFCMAVASRDVMAARRIGELACEHVGAYVESSAEDVERWVARGCPTVRRNDSKTLEHDVEQAIEAMRAARLEMGATVQTKRKPSSPITAGKRLEAIERLEVELERFVAALSAAKIEAAKRQADRPLRGQRQASAIRASLDLYHALADYRAAR